MTSTHSAAAVQPQDREEGVVLAPAAAAERAPRSIPLVVYREASQMVRESGQTHWIYRDPDGWSIELAKRQDVMAEAVIAPRYVRRGLIA